MRDTAPDPRGPSPAHAGHDELLVAAHAAGDASGRDLERASALLAACPECAALHRDLRAIAAALASAPAPARPRDFGITPERAAGLRRPRGWRRLLAPLAGARSAAGPLAASLAALGLAGLLVGGGVGLPLGGATSAPASDAAGAMSPLGPITAAGDRAPSDAASSPFGLTPTPPPDPEPTREAATIQANLIDVDHAAAIARAARPDFAREKVLDARLGTFAQLHESIATLKGPAPAPDDLVWRINLGWVLGPLDGQGVIVIIDATDGHVIQTVNWIS